MRTPFSGWHMTGVLVGGFGIVVAVNFFMASQAVGSFGGVVVENSYVASQNFNSWLAAAEEANELGWTAEIARSGDGRLEVRTQGTPEGVTAIAELRHPLGRSEPLRWELDSAEGDRFLSEETLPEGRWLVRLILAEGEREYRIERPLG